MANHRKSRRWIWVIGLLPILGGAAFFSLKAVGKGSTKIDPAKLVKVERIDLTRSVVAVGKIEAANKVEIKSKASGIIEKLPFEIGQVVRQGQVICKLDENDLLPRVREAKASLTTAEAALSSAKAEYERNKVDAAGPDLPFLKRDLERARTLFAGGLIAPQARDESEKQYEMALNRQRSATANLAVSQAAIAKAAAQTGADAGRAHACRRRPAQRHHRLAHRRRPSLARSRGRRRRQLHPHHGLRRDAHHDARESLGGVCQGEGRRERFGKNLYRQPARITVESYKDQKFSGKVTMISPMGVEKDNVTTFEVRVSISNQSGKLRAQMSANAEVILEEKKGVLAVPEGALLYKKDKSTEVEVPDPTSEKGRQRIASSLGSATDRRPKSCAV